MNAVYAGLVLQHLIYYYPKKSPTLKPFSKNPEPIRHPVRIWKHSSCKMPSIKQPNRESQYNFHLYHRFLSFHTHSVNVKTSSQPTLSATFCFLAWASLKTLPSHSSGHSLISTCAVDSSKPWPGQRQLRPPKLTENPGWTGMSQWFKPNCLMISSSFSGSGWKLKTYFIHGPTHGWFRGKECHFHWDSQG